MVCTVKSAHVCRTMSDLPRLLPPSFSFSKSLKAFCTFLWSAMSMPIASIFAAGFLTVAIFIPFEVGFSNQTRSSVGQTSKWRRDRCLVATQVVHPVNVSRAQPAADRSRYQGDQAAEEDDPHRCRGVARSRIGSRLHIGFVLVDLRRKILQGLIDVGLRHRGVRRQQRLCVFGVAFD